MKPGDVRPADYRKACNLVGRYKFTVIAPDDLTDEQREGIDEFKAERLEAREAEKEMQESSANDIKKRKAEVIKCRQAAKVLLAQLNRNTDELTGMDIKAMKAHIKKLEKELDAADSKDVQVEQPDGQPANETKTRRHELLKLNRAQLDEYAEQVGVTPEAMSAVKNKSQLIQLIMDTEELEEEEEATPEGPEEGNELETFKALVDGSTLEELTELVENMDTTVEDLPEEVRAEAAEYALEKTVEAEAEAEATEPGEETPEATDETPVEDEKE